MKWLVLIGDGMADHPQDFPDGKTPLVVAKKPYLDLLAQKGTLGRVRTVPKGMHAGSDVANMSILGYDPLKYYTGRAPIEAYGCGIELEPEQVAFRCNLVSLREESGKLLMHDYSADHISNDEAKKLIQALNQNLADEQVRFYPSVSYRNLCLIRGINSEKIKIPPPHDILNQPIAPYLEELGQEPEAGLILKLMKKSKEIFKTHPVNLARKEQGKLPADMVWLWGQGKAPKFPTLKERYGISGVVISGVDLVRGLGKLAGLEIVRVPGATGYIDTNYEGKVEYALRALREGADFVYLHLEAPDEASHQGDLELKIKAIELFDQRILKPILDGLATLKPWKMLVMPDHTTPVRLRTHHDDPVPFVVISSEQFYSNRKINRIFSEQSAAKTGILIEQGYNLLDEYLFGGENGKGSSD